MFSQFYDRVHYLLVRPTINPAIIPAATSIDSQADTEQQIDQQTCRLDPSSSPAFPLSYDYKRQPQNSILTRYFNSPWQSTHKSSQNDSDDCKGKTPEAAKGWQYYKCHCTNDKGYNCWYRLGCGLSNCGGYHWLFYNHNLSILLYRGRCIVAKCRNRNSA